MLLPLLLGQGTGGGATTYYQTCTGSITGAGSLRKRTQRKLLGTSTVTGLVRKKTSIRKTGTFTASAIAAKRTKDDVKTGSITPAGSLTQKIKFGKAVAGSITGSGVIRRKISKRVLGAFTASGSLRKLTRRVTLGSLSIAASVARRTRRRVAASITASGAITKVGLKLSKLTTGAVTAAGTVSRNHLTFVSDEFIRGVRRLYSLMSR